jgi:hypothetical protein
MIESIFGPVLSIAALIALWVFEGFSLKYLDQIVDEGRIVKKVFLWAVISVAGVAAGFFMVTDAFTSGSVFALVLGMILAKKIDNKLWFYQIVIVFSSYIIFLNIIVMLFLSWIANFIEAMIAFFIVLAFSILDEVVHNASEKAHRALRWFGEWRFVMKIVVLIMWLLLPFVEWYHALAWILFDLMYEITARHYQRLLKKKPEPLQL